VRITILILLLAASSMLFAANSSALPFSLLQLREVIIFAVVLSYIFASGKIADFLQSSGRKMSKKEVLLAPFAYLFFAVLCVLIYFSSGLWVPPQATIITTLVYLFLIPVSIVVAAGTVVLHAFFRDRLTAVQSLHLSIRIMFAPLFDGLKGYWTALTAAAILVILSGISFYSSGGNFSLATFDFLLLSAIASLYFLYRALTAGTNESKASNFVTVLTLISPAVLRLFFKDLVCALLSLIPFKFFTACPLYEIGSEVTLAFSVLATLVVLVPVIPFIYAVMVNILRFVAAIEIMLKKEPKARRKA